MRTAPVGRWDGALYLSVALASAALAAAIVLKAMFPVTAVPEGPAARR